MPTPRPLPPEFPERLSAFNRLCQKIDVANQVPDVGDIGKLYGFDDAEAFKKGFIDWLNGPEFR